MLYICPVFKDQRAPQAMPRDLTRFATCPSSLAPREAPVKGNLSSQCGRQAIRPKVSHGDSDEYSTPPAPFGKGGTHFFLNFLQNCLFIEHFFKIILKNIFSHLYASLAHVQARANLTKSLYSKKKNGFVRNPLIT